MKYLTAILMITSSLTMIPMKADQIYMQEDLLGEKIKFILVEGHSDEEIKDLFRILQDPSSSLIEKEAALNTLMKLEGLNFKFVE